MQDDRTYFEKRSKQERELALAASDPAVKNVHLDLAAKYTSLSTELAGSVLPEADETA